MSNFDHLLQAVDGLSPEEMTRLYQYVAERCQQDESQQESQGASRHGDEYGYEWGGEFWPKEQ
jgi:hypothetical protein